MGVEVVSAGERWKKTRCLRRGWVSKPCQGAGNFVRGSGNGGEGMCVGVAVGTAVDAGMEIADGSVDWDHGCAGVEIVVDAVGWIGDYVGPQMAAGDAGMETVVDTVRIRIYADAMARVADHSGIVVNLKMRVSDRSGRSDWAYAFALPAIEEERIRENA